MKMRWLILSLLVTLLVPVGALAQTPAPLPRKQPPGSTKPAIEITNTTYDFGKIYKQDKYTHAFTVRNVGNADLVIEEVKPG